ncbi:isoprenylcysteine carboxylmethyltransferase family protein [Oceanisphaera sp. IT1-181]|uniref:methyltransferase family protein n=1 Tax=Oceanisphaera sp. IT1-181 TaxID=3081199 RepID=UPI0029C9DF98|nr:isoprenylcysteine carboxylmethyltransferase family protein [Oceanisphaera sp. IT1-181]
MSWRQRLLWLPPPVITGLAALMMWLTSTKLAGGGVSEIELAGSGIAGQPWLFLMTIAVGIAGLLLMLVSVLTLRRAHTTLLPFAPERTTALVTQGIFSYSRNPIYVGDLMLLLAWALWLGSAINVLWLALFVLYMSKVQIAAEEQALQTKFGLAYQQYCQRVRRWL